MRALREILPGALDLVGADADEAATTEERRPDPRVACAHVPSRFADRFLDTFEVRTKAQRAMVAAARAVVAGDLRNLVIVGGPGAGKTDLSARTANEIAAVNEAPAQPLRTRIDELRALDGSPEWNPYTLRDAIEKVERKDRWLDRICPRWINVPRLVADLKVEMSAGGHAVAEELSELRSAPGLLVLDDVGRERISEWTGELLYVLANERYEAERQTIVTSNVRAADLQARGYGAIVSRLVEGGQILEVDAADYRLKLRSQAGA